jgi:hypothetical protein
MLFTRPYGLSRPINADFNNQNENYRSLNRLTLGGVAGRGFVADFLEDLA